MATSPATAFAIPGPRPLPIVGPMGNLAQFFRNPISYMGRAFKRYGPIVALA